MQTQTATAATIGERSAGEPRALVIRRIGTGLVCLATAGGALAFGAVETWAWAAAWAACAGAFLCAVAAWIVEKRAGIVFAPILGATGLVAVLALAQIIPLPAAALVAAGARAQDIYAILFESGRHAISLAPGETFRALLKSTGVLMAVFATLALVRSRGMLLALVGAAGATALVAAAAGVTFEGGGRDWIYGVRNLSMGADTVNWRSAAIDPALSSGVARVSPVDAGEGTVFFRRSVNIGDVFGPYANSNHFGGFMEIALPLLAAMLLALVETRRRDWGEEGGLASSTEGNLLLFAGVTLALGTGAVVYCGSVGAMGGLAAGFACVFLAGVASRRIGRGTAVAAAVIAAGAATAVIVLGPGLMETVRGKIAEREQVWAVARGIFADFPYLGAGLGAYGSVAPHYESTELKFLFAHNDYLQFAAEAGIVGAAGVALLALWQAWRLARGAFLKDLPYCAAISTGALGAAAAVGFHSLFDFNLHVPANVLALAVLVSAGSVAAAGSSAKAGEIAFRETVLFAGRRSAKRAFIAAALAVLVGAGAVGATVAADGAAGRARVMLARFDGGLPNNPPATLGAVTADVRRAARLSPLDAAIRYQQARLAWAAAHYETDATRAEALRSEAKRAAAAAARLSPAYTFYAMTAAKLGAPARDTAGKWPMQESHFQRSLADEYLENGREQEGLDAMKRAAELAVTDPTGPEPYVKAIVGDLVGRYETPERAAAVAPDTFGGHLAFGAALSEAGFAEAATREFTLAAACASSDGKRAGFSERTAAALADSLKYSGQADEAGRLYETALTVHPGWQYLRLERARYLAASGLKGEAQAEVAKVLAAQIPAWLTTEAVALSKELEGK